MWPSTSARDRPAHLPLAARVEWVWAVTFAATMGEFLRAKAASASLDNIEAVTASAINLRLGDGSIDLGVSNCCFHHLARQASAGCFPRSTECCAPGDGSPSAT
jgi:hypothetical protein